MGSEVAKCQRAEFVYSRSQVRSQGKRPDEQYGQISVGWMISIRILIAIINNAHVNLILQRILYAKQNLLVSYSTVFEWIDTDEWRTSKLLSTSLRHRRGRTEEARKGSGEEREDADHLGPFEAV